MYQRRVRDQDQDEQKRTSGLQRTTCTLEVPKFVMKCRL